MHFLIKPLQLGHVALHNRLVMPPMARYLCDGDGSVTQKLVDYYSEKSLGGYIGLVIVEHSTISSNGKQKKNQLAISDDHLIVGLRKLADAIHANGSKTIIQLNHAGSKTTNDVIQMVPVAPSAIVHPYGSNVPRELSKKEIVYIIDAFHDATRRAKEAGFDGVEIHSAHGYLLNQFFSPLTNRRTDEYGGSLINRIRIHLQILEAVRAIAGKDFLIFLRLGASDFMAGGTTIEDSLIAAQALARGGAQVLDISGGLSGSNVPALKGEGYFSPLTEAIKKVVTVPVLLTGGITKAESAERLLAEGKADLVGVGRAILRDSKWAERAIMSLRNG